MFVFCLMIFLLVSFVIEALYQVKVFNGIDDNTKDMFTHELSEVSGESRWDIFLSHTCHAAVNGLRRSEYILSFLWQGCMQEMEHVSPTSWPTCTFSTILHQTDLAIRTSQEYLMSNICIFACGSP